MELDKVNKAIRTVSAGFKPETGLEVTTIGGAVMAARALAKHFTDLAAECERKAEKLEGMAQIFLETGKLPETGKLSEEEVKWSALYGDR